MLKAPTSALGLQRSTARRHSTQNKARNNKVLAAPEKSYDDVQKVILCWLARVRLLDQKGRSHDPKGADLFAAARI
jgi:hypothetical protein